MNPIHEHATTSATAPPGKQGPAVASAALARCLSWMAKCLSLLANASAGWLGASIYIGLLDTTHAVTYDIFVQFMEN